VAERRRQLKWYERPAESFAKSRVGGWYFINVAMRIDRRLLPLTKGRVSSGFGQQVGLLETTGAKSGEPRAIPLLYLTDGDRIVLIASKGGAPKHPAWLHNVRKHPNVSFLAPHGRSGDYFAREAKDEERERLWAEAVDYYAGYETYQGRAGAREIPVVVLERAV
jgi:deazaflavin-dependent oxidoreductase (nitroreductase family)